MTPDTQKAAYFRQGGPPEGSLHTPRSGDGGFGVVSLGRGDDEGRTKGIGPAKGYCGGLPNGLPNAASHDEPEQDQGTHAPGDWVTIEAVLTNEDALALNDAAQLVAAESGGLVHNRKIKLGQVIAALAADFLDSR